MSWRKRQTSIKTICQSHQEHKKSYQLLLLLLRKQTNVSPTYSSCSLRCKQMSRTTCALPPQQNRSAIKPEGNKHKVFSFFMLPRTKVNTSVVGPLKYTESEPYSHCVCVCVCVKPLFAGQSPQEEPAVEKTAIFSWDGSTVRSNIEGLMHRNVHFPFFSSVAWLFTWTKTADAGC